MTTTKSTTFVLELDKIEQDDDFPECFWGYKNNILIEVFPLSSEDTEEELMRNGYAKCISPFCQEEFVFVVKDWFAKVKDWVE